MQIYAKNEKNVIISAEVAHKQIDYKCLECESTVRLRAGSHRRKHFFHIFSKTPCRLKDKSTLHIEIQNALASILPKNECEIEKVFKKIKNLFQTFNMGASVYLRKSRCCNNPVLGETSNITFNSITGFL